MGKTYNKKTFELSPNITIECEGYETRYSWGHKAYLFYKGRLVNYKKYTYYNRTWEAYIYQSIIHGIIDSTPKKYTGNKENLKRKADSIGEGGTRNSLKTIGIVAKMGELFTKNKKESNDWKARMLKAGFPEGAISMPEDWPTLSEDEKEKRLNAAINSLT